ncbi:hypothetical protein BASA50_000428 [Batrachochytrium salamandrivorans]|uniref:Exportin-T n=1 Tax=Batrachochytrium salamandrivorans TaxID=1357716 RepID=A0ABQ8EWC2_9FUNG|nr:hypothetical protein BASA61_008745 [Batrachochytrium salamandrivorans]KAH6586473.1 hypothetical protein BASA50_000428 [Batrachochytrium salamandrivorans]
MDDLCQAVGLAFSPSSSPLIKSQATAYCNQVRESSRGWELCANILVSTDSSASAVASSYGPELLFFCLQVVEDVLRNRPESLTGEDRMLLQQSIWGLLQPYHTDSGRPIFLKNKLSVVIVLLFKAQYPVEWPTFFEQLFSLLSSSGTQRSMILAFLHICIIIDEEVVCQYVPRMPDDVVRNNSIKDWMREGPVERLTKTWLELLRSNYMTDAEITNTCIGLFGAYASWADINLIIQPEFVEALLGFLSMSELRIAACECISEIVGKGMKVADKLKLLQLLRLPAVIGTFESGSVEFDEQAAKLVNSIGMELCHCCQEGQSSLEREQSLVVLQQLFPFLITYLANEYDDTVSALLPFVQSLLLLMKRIKGPTVTQEQREFLIQLLQVLIIKMKFLEDEEYKLGADAGESEALFSDLRKSFKSLLESIASIDDALFVSCISSTVLHNFELLVQGTQVGKAPQDAINWPDIEVSLHLLHIFIEAKPFKASPIYILESGDLSPLGQMLSRLFESDVAAYPHISISILYFEILVRYSQFFEQCPQYLPQALNAFVGTRGLHHSNISVRLRLNYLFLRFTKHLRQHIGPYVEGILSSISDLIVIARRQVVSGTSNGGNPTSQQQESTAADGSMAFDSQLYLFECVGHLISAEAVDTQKRLVLLKNVLSPIIYTIESHLQQSTEKNEVDEQTIILLADTTVAIGSVSKGFPDYSGDSLASGSSTGPSAQPSPPKRAMDAQLIQIFQEVLCRILLVLQRFSDNSLIREACRSSLQCMVGCVGPVILDHLPMFLSSGLLSSTTATELIDFLPFIGLMIYKFKFSIVDILIELWSPLRDKIFIFLNQQAVGTDDLIQQLALRRSYLTMLSALFNSEMQVVLTCPVNVVYLNTTLQSILLCLDERSDVTVHKLVFSLFSKMVYCWAGTEATANDAVPISTQDALNRNQGALADGTLFNKDASLSKTSTTGNVASNLRSRDASLKRAPLNGFNQFFLESILPAMFELPLRPNFNPLDGQALVLFGDIATLHKTAVDILGMEYINYIGKSYLPSRGCPDETAQLFTSNLLNLDKKELKKYLQTFVRAARSVTQR